MCDRGKVDKRQVAICQHSAAATAWLHAGRQRARLQCAICRHEQASCQGGVYGDKTPGELTSTAWLPLHGCMQGVAQRCLNSSV